MKNVFIKIKLGTTTPFVNSVGTSSQRLQKIRVVADYDDYPP